ncbi:MAG: hypothetical protein ACRDLK_04720 [Gaiellaceae bacterium]
MTTTVWLAPSATSFACLCETCLETARTAGALFADALRVASVRGEVDADATAAVARCAAGHEILLRRVERPPRLASRDERQLQLT